MIRPVTDRHGHPVIIEPRGDRIHVDVLDENGVRKIAEFTDLAAMEFIRDLLAYLWGYTP